MTNGKPKLLTIPDGGQNLAETDMAYGIRIDNKTVWLPKSQIQEWEVLNGNVSFWIPEWLIADKGLDIFVDTSYEPSLF